MDDGREHGPFAAPLEAVQSMQASDGAPEPEPLAEAESEIGIADRVDLDTDEH